jgi:hypothetical protein
MRKRTWSIVLVLMAGLVLVGCDGDGAEGDDDARKAANTQHNAKGGQEAPANGAATAEEAAISFTRAYFEGDTDQMSSLWKERIPAGLLGVARRTAEKDIADVSVEVGDTWTEGDDAEIHLDIRYRQGGEVTSQKGRISASRTDGAWKITGFAPRIP